MIVVSLPAHGNAQVATWAPPENGPEVIDVSPPLNTGTTAQIKSGLFGIDLKGTSLTIPFGTGFFVRAGSLFVEKIGLGVLGSWVPSSLYAVDTNAPIRAHGVESSSDVTVLPFRTYVSSESNVCANVATGVLQKCSAPTLTFTASPSTISTAGNVLSWTSVNTSSCAGTGFDTGGGVSGSVIVFVTGSATYTVTCTGYGGMIAKSVTLKLPNPSILTLTATPNPFAMVGGSSTIKYTTQNATSCSCRIYANQGAATWMSTCGTNLSANGQLTVSNSTFYGASREVGIECVNGDNPLKAYRRVWVQMQ